MIQTENHSKITKDISIEDLIIQKPSSIKYLMDKGIRCLVCGEPIWGTLESATKEKGLDDKEIQIIVHELNST